MNNDRKMIMFIAALFILYGIIIESIKLVEKWIDYKYKNSVQTELIQTEENNNVDIY